MSRTTCISNDKIRLLYAQESDRRLIYDLSFEDKDVILSMFDQPEDFHWEELRDANPIFFNEQPGLSKYLLIEYEQEIVGVFCHDYHQAPIPNMEFHIWMRSTKYTGKGIGTQVLKMMIEYIRDHYQVNTFMMRPWTKNLRAIRTYEKCGFQVKSDFKLTHYFTAAEIEQYGNGAYSEEETANMILSYS